MFLVVIEEWLKTQPTENWKKRTSYFLTKDAVFPKTKNKSHIQILVSFLLTTTKNLNVAVFLFKPQSNKILFCVIVITA